MYGESHWVIIVAPPIDSWRLFNPLSPCWAQIYFPLFCLAQVRELHLPLALTLISQNTSVHSQHRCQITGSWKALTLRDEVDLSDYVNPGKKSLLPNITTKQSKRQTYITIQVLFTAVGVFWKYRPLTIKVFLSQHSWSFSFSPSEWRRNQTGV